MKAVGSGSDGGVDRGPGTWAAKMFKTNNNLQGSLDSGLLPEGHFLAPRIGRTVYFLDFSDSFIKNVFFEFIIFLEVRCSPGPRLGGAFYLICLPNFEKIKVLKK